MDNARTPLRPGMTALAAALALTATPLFAQDAAPAPAAAEAAPVTVSPPAPVLNTAPAATPAPEASTMSSVPTVAPAVPTVSAAPTPAPATIKTATPTMEPVVHQPDPADVAAAERASARAATRSATRSNAPATTQTAAAARTAAPAVPAVAPATTPAEPAAPVIAPTEATPVAKATPAPAPVQPAVQTSDDTLPIAGGVGAAILLLAGGAFAFSRRRRDDEVEEVVYETTPETLIAPTPVAVSPVVAPVIPVAAAPRIDTASSAVTELPAGFDISRFGRHTQAAYRGPTPENPSLSLKKRLKVASFYDGRERMAAEGVAVAPTPAASVAASAATVKTAPSRPARSSDHITIRAPKARPTTFKPAFSS